MSVNRLVDEHAGVEFVEDSGGGRGRGTLNLTDLELGFGLEFVAACTFTGWSVINGFTMAADQSFTVHPYMLG